jgi:hypothetical protein
MQMTNRFYDKGVKLVIIFYLSPLIQAPAGYFYAYPITLSFITHKKRAAGNPCRSFSG